MALRIILPAGGISSEARIAPASVLTFTDVDGDTVKITSTLGDLNAPEVMGQSSNSDCALKQSPEGKKKPFGVVVVLRSILTNETIRVALRNHPVFSNCPAPRRASVFMPTRRAGCPARRKNRTTPVAKY